MAAANAITLYTREKDGGPSFFFGPGFFLDVNNLDGVDGQEKINTLSKPAFGVNREYISARDFDVARIVAKRAVGR